MKIRIPQNPYRITGLTGGEYSTIFYDAIKRVMELNPDVEFIYPVMDLEQMLTDPKSERVDWNLLYKNHGRPY